MAKADFPADNEIQEQFAAHLEANPPKLDGFEKSLTSGVKRSIGSFKAGDWSPLDDSFLYPKDKVYELDTGIGIARCQGTIHCSPERAIAWAFHIESDYNLLKHKRTNGLNLLAYPNREIERINDHHQIKYTCRKLPFPLNARDFCTRNVISIISPDVYVYRLASEERSVERSDEFYRERSVERNDEYYHFASLCSASVSPRSSWRSLLTLPYNFAGTSWCGRTPRPVPPTPTSLTSEPLR